MKLILEIPRRNQDCSVGNEHFEPGGEYISTLIEDHHGEFIRRDYCLNCWKPQEHVGFWKGKIPIKTKKLIGPTDRDERALYFLKEAIKENLIEEAFVLALFLARKKMIYLRQEITTKEGIVFLAYEVAETEEMLSVKKVDLSLLNIEKVQMEIATKLGRDA